MDSAWNIDDITKQSLLYDFYGELLTKRQREVMELYHGENLSLAEIAEEFGISRQAVHDALRNGQKALDGYEEKLGLVRRFLRTENAIEKIDHQILELIEKVQKGGFDPHTDLVRQLRRIKSIIDQLEE